MPKCSIKTRYIPATFAWTVLIVATTLFFYYPAQYYLPQYPWVLIGQAVITFFVLANFTMATFMDPGVIPKAPPDEDRDDDFRAPLYKNVEINGITVRMKWCVTCKFYRPPRCSHCSVCNHCIETFDHHCPWVNNCIGRRNYRFFFFFLISLSLHMTSIFTLSLIYVLHYKQSFSNVEPIVAFCLMSLVVLVAIPIFGLTLFHMVLVSRGRTTNEQVTGKFKGGYNPFSKGCWHNCCYTQCGPQFPSIIKPPKYLIKKKHCQHGSNSTNGNDNQVKTYMDNSNGVRTLNSNVYNKMSPGRDLGGDLEMEPPIASQSQDCEPTPPPLMLHRHGSKTNFYMGTNVAAMSAQQQQQQQPPPVAGGAVGFSSVAVTAPTITTTTGFGEVDSPRHHRTALMHHHYVRNSPHPKPRGLPLVEHHHQSSAQTQQLQQQQQYHLLRGSTPDSLSNASVATMQRASPALVHNFKTLNVTSSSSGAPSRSQNTQQQHSPARRSNPSTPTQPRRPDFINVVPSPSAYYDPHHYGVRTTTTATTNAATYSHHFHQHHQQYPQYHPQYQYGLGPLMTTTTTANNNSPQRRFMSEGELIRHQDTTATPSTTMNQLMHHPARSNTAADNIRELANSPQRGMYLWKDMSPSGGGVTSAPSLAAQLQQRPPPLTNTVAASNRPPYHPALRGGVPVFPQAPPPPSSSSLSGASPLVGRKFPPNSCSSSSGGGGGGGLVSITSTASTASATSVGSGRRPASFVRALEMGENSVQMTSSASATAATATAASDDVRSASGYDLNYEISV